MATTQEQAQQYHLLKIQLQQTLKVVDPDSEDHTTLQQQLDQTNQRLTDLTAQLQQSQPNP